MRTMERADPAIVPEGRQRSTITNQKPLVLQIFALKTSAAANFCG
jgi:hypothetical protein